MASPRRKRAFIPIALAAKSDTPIYRQIFSHIREAILSGQLSAGVRLPSSRSLSSALRVSRNSVVAAYDQLLSDGYILSRVGDGSWVSEVPTHLLRNRATTPPAAATPGAPGAQIRLSRRASQIVSAPIESKWLLRHRNQPLAFRVGLPAIDLFPFDQWSRVTAKIARTQSRSLAVQFDTAGLPRLRQAIASYLALSRGVVCRADQVLVVSGAQAGLDLTLRLLLDVGDTALIEDPCYLGIRGALIGVGGRICAVPVDAWGFDIARAEQLAPEARVALVAPSHQFPMAVTMPLERRVLLLEWARRRNAWIVEDDYDSEFRYVGRPLSPLQSLDRDGRVIYIGTFSKVLYPSLRLGYVVVPDRLLDAFWALQRFSNATPPAFDQAVVTSFIEEGHFARHVRRMRQAHLERGAALVEAARDILPDAVAVRPPQAGLHTLLDLPPELSDENVADIAAAKGIDVRPISMYAIHAPPQASLALGFACVPEGRMAAGLRVLRAAINEARSVQRPPTPPRGSPRPSLPGRRRARTA